MKILDTRVYRGPNLYGYRPMVRVEVDLEDLEAYPTTKIRGFIDGLLELIPTLHEHGCSYGEPGGLVRRMREGTWMGHVMEHIAIELQCLAGTPVTEGKTRGTGEYGQYYVIYQYKEEEVGVAAGEFALDVIRYLLPARFASAIPKQEKAQFDFQQRLESYILMAQEKALGPSTAALVAAAEKRNIPWIRLNEFSLIQFGHGKYQKRIEATVTSNTNHIAVEIAQDKELTNRLLRDAGLPVPRSVLVHNKEEAWQAARELGLPVVVKPLDGNHGRGVSLNLSSRTEVLAAFKQARQESRLVIVEQYLTGQDFRILVINGEVVAATERVPGHIAGDGTHTIKELIDLVNSDPRRGVGHEKVLTRIDIDEQAKRLIRAAGHTLETVLPQGEIFYLRRTGNLSTGGTAIDRTDEIHYENMQIARRAIQIAGLDVGGVDLITPDISQPVSEVGGGIVEINAAPGFRMHVAPSEGKPREVADKVIEYLFPPNSPARIPIAAITGTNGKTTTTRMAGHIMKQKGHIVGMTTTDGIYVDGERILKGDMTGPWSARVVLREPAVDCAVLETARGGILREGLGFYRCEVGAVLNIAADHLGLRGIETVEDLAYVKRLVIEMVKDDGWAVLNADDELTREMAEHTDGSVCWFSMDPKNELIRRHVRQGGRALVLENGVNGDMLTLYDEGKHVPLLWAHLIPATHEGRARFNIANALAAAAICYCLGSSIETIRIGLQTFDMTYYQAPGRLNIFDEYPFRVIVDYAHNPAAMRAVGDFIRSLDARGQRIGVIGAPGDRRNVDITELGTLAANYFDELIIREDWHLRGRPAGEIAALLHAAAQQAGMAAAAMRIIANEFDAIRHALDHARAGDLIVIFADDIPGAWKLVTKYRHPEVYQNWLASIGQPSDGAAGWAGLRREPAGEAPPAPKRRRKQPVPGSDSDD